MGKKQKAVICLVILALLLITGLYVASSDTFRSTPISAITISSTIKIQQTTAAPTQLQTIPPDPTLIPSASTPSPFPVVQSNKTIPEYGVCLHIDQFDPLVTIEQLKKINSSWVRIDWDTNSINYSIESALTTLKDNGVKILAILDHKTMNYSDFTLSQWCFAVEKIMSTEAAKKVDAWEIWNEPNSIRFYLGYMDGNPRHYTDMLKEAYRIIKYVSPNALVIAAGLSPEVPTWKNPNWESWLKEFNVTSPQAYFDFQAIHLYADEQTNNYIITQTKAIMNVEDIWVTEIGQPSSPIILDNLTLNYSPENQSLYLNQSFQFLRSITQSPVFWYQLKDENNNATEIESNFGLFDTSNRPKPAANTFTVFSSLT